MDETIEGRDWLTGRVIAMVSWSTTPFSASSMVEVDEDMANEAKSDKYGKDA